MTARFVALLPLLVLTACTPTRRVLEVTEVDRPPDVTGDSLVAEVTRARIRHIQPTRPTPDVAPSRSVDFLSTALDLRFDLEERAVIGTAEHHLTSLRDDLDSFYLHGVGMEIASVESLPEVSGGAVPVAYDYDGQRLTITPERPLAYGEALRLRITYTAHPMETAGQSGLSFSGFGLYFIDPEGTDPFRPTQLWTQGQTEDNRRWYPTWDYPNDKATLDVTLTVPDSMQTFGNGTLVESTPAGEGLRRDRWVLDTEPQASYLTAFVVGDFAVVEDEYMRGDSTAVPLQYIVEPAYAGDARRIFGETPAMIAAFEAETGVRYPWANYKQATVRDFTAGGMENTTLTILWEGVQTDPRGYLDYTARDLIAHELAHQWFGNLTTAEDWANLAINESFASYLEEIYLEQAIGRAAAQAHGIDDRDAYLQQAQTLRRPIVWYGYDQEGQMFDRHTYQKGGQVLNQLRFELGDAAWRRGLNHFLTTHAGEPVEIDDLRTSMEGVSGRSLRRFFDQWFRQPGHPALDVEQAYFPGSDVYTIQVTQTQDRSQEPLFAFDVNVELNFPNAPREVRRFHLASADTTLRFRVPEKPSFVRFDEGNWLFADIALTQPVDELVAMSADDDEMAGRYDGVDALADLPENPVVRQALVAALTDIHPKVRERAAEALEDYIRAPGVAEALARRIRDPEASVRGTALDALSTTENTGLLESTLREALADSSYGVVAAAIRLYAARFPEQAYDAYEAEGLPELTSWNGVVEQALMQAIGTLRDERGGTVLLARVGPNNPDAVRAAGAAGIQVLALDHAVLREPAREAYRTYLDDRLEAVRLAVVRGLARFGEASDIARLEERLEVEESDEVKAALRMALGQIRSRQSGTQLDQ